MGNTQFDRVASQLGLSFLKKGMKVEVHGRKGKVKDFDTKLNLEVLFDGSNEVESCKASKDVIYFNDDGTITNNDN